jgi:ribosomal protein L11 methyltransferase
VPTDFILAIACAPEHEDILQARLFLTGSTGSTSADGVIQAWFDSAADRHAASELLRDFDLTPIDRERVDWLTRYQQSLAPILVGDRFVVAPDAALFPETERLRIIVPQEQAFGTGSHETTSLCMELLESVDVRGKRGLDAGSGSGILSLAQLRLGARKVVAFDNDPDAYAALRDNRARNDIDAAAMPIFIGGIEALRAGTFDMITMNILPEVIIELLPAIVERMSGALIVSGVLTSRRDDVMTGAAATGLRLRRERTKGEWWAGVLERGQPRVSSGTYVRALAPVKICRGREIF